MTRYDYVIIGAGIVGLASAREIGKRFPGARVLVLEKESEPARHQTGRNSGVIHSGIYYKPGSFKARFAKAGAESMVRFCSESGIPYEVCGKLVVATRGEELPLLDELERRGRLNGVPVQRISAERAREVEPYVSCIAALHVESTGITDYVKVALEYRRQVEVNGGEVICDTEVLGLVSEARGSVVLTKKGEFTAGFVVNCAGLYSDRIARSQGTGLESKIVPFRGEYYELTPSRRHLVKSLIYPVPDPDFPFLGVHFTRMIGGSVHAGPNAVLAFAREGYRRSDFNLRDFWDTVGFEGFWRLAATHAGDGLREVYRSLSKRAFTRSLQRLVPEVRQEDLVACDAGIRAQALARNGKLLDDFSLVRSERALHVCNAPSPGATASLEIAKEIASQIPDVTATRLPATG